MEKVPRLVTAFTVAAVLVSACTTVHEEQTSPESSTNMISTTTTVVVTTTSSTTTVPTTTTATTTTTSTAAPTTAVPQEPLQIPDAGPPQIDGILGDGEWDDATTDSMSDGATVHFMHSGGILYIAVAGDEVGAVNVLLATSNEVRILHSSAALGSALYLAGTDGWELSHGYDWCCRNSSDESQRLELFENEAWLANIGYAGDPGVVEYAIKLPWTEAAVAISSIRDENDTGFWPAGLSEEARSQLLGIPPQQRAFDLEEWRHVLPGAG